MEKTEKNQTSRRNFLTRGIPLCALTCFGAGKIFAGPSMAAGFLSDEEKHKFDNELPGPKITYRQIARIGSRNLIRFAKFLQKELGKERVFELIKKATDERMLERAKQDLKRLGKSDFKSYISIFRDPRMLATLNMEIIEDTDTVFEIRVTDCLSATAFLSEKAGDIGFASVCWGDYMWAEGFNPKIKLVRDKTLMQGHKYCNHKYLWTG